MTGRTVTASRAQKIIKLLETEYPDARIELDYTNPLQLIVATILSAQSTDKTINKITKDLFRKYKTAQDYANTDIKVFEQDIKSSGFYHNKAKNIIGMANKLVSDFDSKVPDNMEDLLTLPGVARKTANVVLAGAYNKAEGIAVDTHVMRLSQRLGFTNQDNPVKIEKDLMELIPKTQWINFTALLVFHGRRTCYARKPNCPRCRINKLCPYIYKTKNAS
jgi:endonuclease III